ncbi:hypothetical protein FHT86_003000 [Rhizobium sp. BK313]|nr:hypothetical protein [Rhizobium sp. BK313]
MKELNNAGLTGGLLFCSAIRSMISNANAALQMQRIEVGDSVAINDLKQIARYQARYQERLGHLGSLLAGGSRWSAGRVFGDGYSATSNRPRIFGWKRQ